jgi:four helix bundle protein
MSFDAHDVAIEIALRLRTTVERIKTHDRDLADQLRQAVNSMALSVGEGARREGKDRLHFFRIAAGSAGEARTALELAKAWGMVEPSALAAGLKLLDRELAILWRLVHPR